MDYPAFFERARKATRRMTGIEPAHVHAMLTDIAAALLHETDAILAENKKDLDRMDPADPKFDRLTLTAQRIQDIATDMVNVAGLHGPLGDVMLEKEMPNGLHISKIRVPL